MTKKLFALALVACTAMPTIAYADVCPAGQKGPNVRPKNDTPAKGVTDDVLTSIDVTKAPYQIANRSFRLRRLVVQPGGVVPWHSHNERPAIIYIVSGAITEYASNCKAPLNHKAGEAVPELSDVSHWWKNNGKTTAVLLSSDLLPTGGHDEMK